MNVPLTLEEFGKAQLYIELDIFGDIFDNGPDWKANFDIEYIKCLFVCGENWDWDRDERSDWFEWLDEIVTDYIMQHEDEFIDKCIQETVCDDY